MSRALGKDIKEALVSGNHDGVFEELSSALMEVHDSLLDIELLGASHFPDASTRLLQDGHAIAVPKLRLVQAFVVARQVLSSHEEQADGSADEATWRATAVVLLMDAEHLSAANARKRLIARALAHRSDASEVLAREKYLVDSLLTSRLHRHTKSPVLWSHRRWLMTQFGRAGMVVDTAKDLRDVVFISAERHARNYYAWSHARQMMASSDPGAGREPPPLDGGALVADTEKWCFRHHDDISGWMFLLFLLKRWPERAHVACSATLKLAASLHWRNESVWYFLRNVVTSGLVGGEQRARFEHVLQTLRTGVQDGGPTSRALDEASTWVETLPPTPVTGTG